MAIYAQLPINWDRSKIYNVDNKLRIQKQIQSRYNQFKTLVQ